jgi:enoyl-[acyl-carrier protein] reductase I
MNDQALFKDKKVLVFGVADERSIAWAISRAFHERGAKLGFTYLGEALERRVRPLAESIGSDLILPCDVASDEQIAQVFQKVQEQWGGLDVLVHSVAFANREDLEGRFIDTSRQGFSMALDISAYSLVALAKAAEPMLTASHGNIVTLTYYGSQKVMPNYNVMGVAKAALEASVRYLASDLGPGGVRVNAISAGPVKTLAASGIKGFKGMLGFAQEKAPLRRNITADEVAGAAVFLCSELGSGVTGETLYVDAGYNVMV